MKKIIALTSCVMLLSCGLAAATELSTTGGNVSGEGNQIYGGISQADGAGTTATLIGKLSKGVKLGAYYTNLGYALTTKHTSGNTQYGTAHDATAIYKQDVGQTPLTAPTAVGNQAFQTNWTAM